MQVNSAIEDAGALDDPDAVNEELGFINIHYYAAAATKYGTMAMGGYEYEGKSYDALFEHVEPYSTCIDCHAAEQEPLLVSANTMLPLREALSGLVRHEHELVEPEVLPYWQDLYDHILVVSETTDSLRDLVSSLVEANLSLRDFRQNQVMKTVSSWAAIVAAPTLITSDRAP